MSKFENKIKQLSLSDLTVLKKIMQSKAVDDTNPSKRDEYSTCANQIKDEEDRRVKELMKL